MVEYFNKFEFASADEDYNDGYLIGNITKDFKPWCSKTGEKFFISHLSVERTSGKNDFIPILLSEEMYRLYAQDMKDKILAYCGHMMGFKDEASDYNVHCVMFRVESLDENIDMFPANNDINLYGTVAAPPHEKLMPDGKIKRYFTLDVFDGSEVSRIPCFTKGNYSQDVALLRPSEKIMFSGRIQTRTISRDSKPYDITEVSINKLHMVEYVSEV